MNVKSLLVISLIFASSLTGRTIRFAGRTWFVRSGYGGPGPNYCPTALKAFGWTPEEIQGDPEGFFKELGSGLAERFIIWIYAELHGEKDTPEAALIIPDIQHSGWGSPLSLLFGV